MRDAAERERQGRADRDDRPFPSRNGRYRVAWLARSGSLGILLPMKIRASSRWLMEVRMLRMASFRVSPKARHPGREGQYALYPRPPSG